LREGDFDFLSAPRGIRERRADVVGLEIRVRGQDVGGGLRQLASPSTR